VALVLGREREAELRLAPFVIAAHAHIADQPRLVILFHGVLEPAEISRVRRRHPGDHPLRLTQRVRRVPGLVPGDVRVGPVGGERRRVLGREAPQDEPFGLQQHGDILARRLSIPDRPVRRDGRANL